METSLQETLSTILTQLADFLGVTTQTIIENAPYWLAKYAWLNAVSDFFLYGLLVVGSVAVVFGISVGLLWMDDVIKNPKPGIKIFTLSIIVVIILIGLAQFIPCLIAPELVGAKELISLIK